MSEKQKATLNFILPNGTKHAMRTWYHVPPAGAVVMLKDPDRDERDPDKLYPARVLLVVWNSKEDKWDWSELTCNVHIAWDDAIKVPTLEEARRKAQCPSP